MEIVTMILTSTVVSTLVTAFIGYLSSRRDNMLKYITEERKNWRIEMRKLAESIEGAQICSIGNELTKLKVRINAFGNVRQDNCFCDGHIWALIKELEKEQADGDEYIRKKRLLVEYISLLLKHDWERSKKEVRGTFEKVLQILLILFSVAMFAFYYFVQWKLTDITEFVIHTVYLILTALFVTLGFRFLNDKAISANEDKKQRLRGLVASLILYAVCMVWVSFFFLQRWAVWPADDGGVILACIYIGFIINLLELISGMREKYAYEGAVRKLQKEGGQQDAHI